MRLAQRKGDFYSELRLLLSENKKLYGGDSVFGYLDTPFGRFVAAQLGVNPWKILVPVAAGIAVFLRLVFGRRFSELVLRVLGGW